MKYPSNKYALYLPLVLILSVGMIACDRDDFTRKGQPEVLLDGSSQRLQADEIHFSKDTVYILATSLTRNDGQVLSIEAGTLIKVNDRLSININPGGRIEAEGTADDPIVFTSSAPPGAAGNMGISTNSARFWYGIRVLGNFLTTKASSGILRYVRVEFAGGDENGSLLPALLLKDIAQETILDNIEVSYSYSTCSFGFYGGDVNAKNLVSYASIASDFYLRDGFTGKLQNLVARRHPYFPANIQRPSPSPLNGLAGIFIEGPTTFPVISNLTVIGPDAQPGTGFYYTNEVSPSARIGAMVVADGARFHLANSALLAFPRAAIYMDSRESAIALQAGVSTFSQNIVHTNNQATPFYLPQFIYPPFTSDDFKAFAMNPQYGNEIYDTSAAFQFAKLFDYESGEGLIPSPGSPLLSGAVFSLPVYDDAFFSKVSYRGAFGADDWMKGWTNFVPSKTNYNN